MKRLLIIVALLGLTIFWVPTAQAQVAFSSECNLVSAASTNATSCTTGVGVRYRGIAFYNTTTTIYYLRLYNIAGAPTCSSATGFIKSIPIPPASAAGQVGGTVVVLQSPTIYPLGLGFCLTGGSSSTDNTNAAVGVFGTVMYSLR